MNDKFQEGIKLIRENAELREENRLVSEQNEKLNDVLLANERELSERLSSEEMVKMQEEHYSSWLKEKEGRLLAEAKVVELREALKSGIDCAKDEDQEHDFILCVCHLEKMEEALASSTDAGKKGGDDA